MTTEPDQDVEAALLMEAWVREHPSDAARRLLTAEGQADEGFKLAHDLNDKLATAEGERDEAHEAAMAAIWQDARIESLEAALREIAELDAWDGDAAFAATAVADRALNPTEETEER